MRTLEGFAEFLRTAVGEEALHEEYEAARAFPWMRGTVFEHRRERVGVLLDIVRGYYDKFGRALETYMASAHACERCGAVSHLRGMDAKGVWLWVTYGCCLPCCQVLEKSCGR